MKGYSTEVFVGIDVAKVKNAVAIADEGQHGEIRYLGEIPDTKEATRKLAKELIQRHERVHFCYEAGPTGYSRHRADQAGSGLHCCGALVNPSAIRRQGQDQSPRRREPGLAAACWRADLGLGAKRDP